MRMLKNLYSKVNICWLPVKTIILRKYENEFYSVFRHLSVLV